MISSCFFIKNQTLHREKRGGEGEQHDNTQTEDCRKAWFIRRANWREMTTSLLTKCSTAQTDSPKLMKSNRPDFWPPPPSISHPPIRFANSNPWPRWQRGSSGFNQLEDKGEREEGPGWVTDLTPTDLAKDTSWSFKCWSCAEQQTRQTDKTVLLSGEFHIHATGFRPAESQPGILEQV